MLEKYNKIWKKVSSIIKKEFDSEPVCNEKYLKTKNADSKNIEKYSKYLLLICITERKLSLFCQNPNASFLLLAKYQIKNLFISQNYYRYKLPKQQSREKSKLRNIRDYFQNSQMTIPSTALRCGSFSKTT